MRKLASFQRIVNLASIKNADRIEVATVLGWRTVVKKGTFKPGDLCIFFEIDSILPREAWSEFLVDKKDPEKPIRLRTVKLRGQISQGLAIPVSEFSDRYSLNLVEGKDITVELGIKEYEPPPPKCREAKGPFPSIVPKTRELRVQSAPKLIEEFKGLQVYVTQKIDGSSFSAIWNNGELDICSHNLSLKEGNNEFWEVALKHDLPRKMERHGMNMAIQGEACGEGFCKNRLGLKGKHLKVFNVWDIDKSRHFSYQGLKAVCKLLDLIMVPVLYEGVFKWNTIEELLELANGTYENGYPQEGIVIRPVEPVFSEVLCDRLSMKVINNQFLLK